MKSSPNANPLEELEEPVLTHKMRETLMAMNADQLDLVVDLIEKFGIEGVSMEERLDIMREVRRMRNRKKIVGTIVQKGTSEPKDDLGENAKIISLFKKSAPVPTPQEKKVSDIKQDKKHPHLKLIK